MKYAASPVLISKIGNQDLRKWVFMSRAVTGNCIVQYIAYDDFDIIVPNVHILYHVRDTAPD